MAWEDQGWEWRANSKNMALNSMRNLITAHCCNVEVTVESLVSQSRNNLFWTRGNLRFSLAPKGVCVSPPITFLQPILPDIVLQKGFVCSILKFPTSLYRPRLPTIFSTHNHLLLLFGWPSYRSPALQAWRTYFPN